MAVRKHGDVDTATEVFNQAMSAFVTQSRREEHLVFPLEFVSDRSSDKPRIHGPENT
jgi:hypothetical protein